MQEQQVTAGGRTRKLEPPFFVLATQNPIEQEGTYPLPEAQLDRFMFLVNVDYPTHAEELQIARATTGEARPALAQVLTGEQIIAYQQLVRRVPVPDHIYDYVVRVVRMTRPGLPETPDWINQRLTWGAGPRAVQFLILGAKVHAVLHGSYLVRQEDVDAVTPEVLGHRVLLNFHAEAEGVTPRDVVRTVTQAAKA